MGLEKQVASAARRHQDWRLEQETRYASQNVWIDEAG